MESSLIPRPRSLHDARRRSEENQREAERRSSARNNDNAKIGAGGSLTLAGGIDVVDNGAVTVIGQGVDQSTGQPYEVTSRLTTYENEGNYGTYQSPALIFSSSIFGERDRAKVWSRSGEEVWIDGGTDLGATSVFVGDGFSAAYNSRDPALSGAHRTGSISANEDGLRAAFADDQAGTEAGLDIRRYNDPTATLHVGHFTWRDSLFARLRTKLGGKLWLESNSAAGASAIVMDGAGNIDIQTTGALTQNGAPISGGSGAVSSVAGKTGAVTLVKADVGLDQVDNTSDVNKPISTKTQVAIDAKGSKTAVSRYTASGTMPSFTIPVPYIGTPSYDNAPAGGSTENLASSGGGTLTVSAAGIYDVDFVLTLGAPVQGRTFIEVQDASEATLNRTSIPTGEDTAGCSVNGYKVAAGAILRFRCYQNTGGARSYNATIRLKKLPS